MNKRKEPSGLQDMAYRKIGEMVRNVGLKWTRRLYSAAERGRNAWLQEIESVEAECVLLRQTISSLPTPMISELIKRCTIEEFTQIVSLYDNNNGRPSITRIWYREVHQKICANILKSVLFPCIPTCNLSKVKSEFVEELLIKLIYLTPNIKILILPEVRKLNYKEHLMRNIQILNNLQQFTFHVGCTIEIIIELSKFCPQLKNISVEGSRCVDNNCVEHLLKLRHLQNLNVAGTLVFNSGYRALVSGLPELQDIIWVLPIDPVLRNLIGRLDSVTRFVGNITSAELLFHKCPNVNKVTLHRTTEDMSALGELRSVSTLTIIRGSCIVMRFSDVIRRLGANLTALEMQQVRDINIIDIIISCTVLNSLDISYCRTMQGEVPDSSLAHFQNLKKLKLKQNKGEFDLISILRMYVNLNEFHVADTEAVTETLIRHIVRTGGFRDLTKFVVEKCGYMSMYTAWLRVQNCPNLTEIGNINTWPVVTTDEVETFLNFIRNNNLSLTFLG